MRIGIVSAWFAGGGAAEVSLAFAKVLLSQDQDVFIYARDENNGPLISTSHPRLQVKKSAPSNSPLIKSVNLNDYKKWLDENKIEVIIFNEQVDLNPVILAKKRRIKCIAYVDYYREDIVQHFSIFDGLICVTKRHFEVFSWHPQAWYLPWGVDLSLFKESHQPSNIPNDFVFFHSCSGDPYRKGTDILIQTLVDNPEFKCTIHAIPNLEITLPKFKELISLLKLRGQLREINQLTRQPGLYHLGKIFVYPSRLDGLGLSMLEAQACGLYLIATNTPPMSEFLIPQLSEGVQVKTYRSRSDGYYWPISEVDSRDLARVMKNSLKFIENCGGSESIRTFVHHKRDIFQNFQLFSDLIQKCPFVELSNSLESKINNSFFQKVPIRFGNPVVRIGLKIYSVFRS